MKNVTLRLISYLVMAYMLVAFGWWSVLLYMQNRDAFQAKSELLRLVAFADERARDQTSFELLPEYRELRADYKRQERMILGEAIFIAVSLLVALWFINSGYTRIIRSSEQQRNFLLSITHELKSPLASIRLVLQTFMRRELPLDKARNFAESGLAETDRLTQLVNDLLLSARLESAYRPDIQPLNLGALLDDVTDTLRRKYPDAYFHLHDDGTVPFIQADRAGITSVAYNLLENAVKYGGENPEITQTLTRSADGKTAHWTVADNGIGIPEADRRRIFEKFYRVGSEETRHTKGTGLGLYIVRETLRAQGGNITVRSNEPYGTIFEVTLKLEEVQEPELEPVA